MIRNTISDHPIEKESQNPGSPFLVRISLDSSNSKFPFSNRPYILPGASHCAGSDAMHTRHLQFLHHLLCQIILVRARVQPVSKGCCSKFTSRDRKDTPNPMNQIFASTYVQLHANAPKQTHDMQRENQKQEKTPGRWKLKENCQTNDGTGLDSIFATWWQDTVPAAIQKS